MAETPVGIHKVRSRPILCIVERTVVDRGFFSVDTICCQPAASLMKDAAGDCEGDGQMSFYFQSLKQSSHTPTFVARNCYGWKTSLVRNYFNIMLKGEFDQKLGVKKENDFNNVSRIFLRVDYTSNV